MFEANTNVVETTENVEAKTTEEIEEGIELTDTTETEEATEVEEPEKEKEEEPKGRYVTDEELNELVDRRVARKMRKFEREKDVEYATYKDTENVLKKTLGANDITEVNEKLRKGYEEQGIELPEVFKPGLSQREVEILAKSDAEEIIEEGYDAMVEEANRLASKEYKNLNDREKVVFNTLAERLTIENDKKELLKLGAKEDLFINEGFKSFRKKFNSNVPMEEIYTLYKESQPKPKVENPGSMKSSKETSKKTFYTDEEISKLTSAELDDPEVWEAVRKSMTSQR